MTLLVAPAPPHGTPPAERRDAGVAAGTVTVVATTAPAADGTTIEELREDLRAIRTTLRGGAADLYLVGGPRSEARQRELEAWHQHHRHLGYLDTTIAAAEGTRLDPDVAGAHGWLPMSALRSTRLPDVGLLVSVLSGPREVLLAGIDAVLALPEPELRSHGAHALLAGLGRAGGVVVGRRGEAPSTATAAPEGDGFDPAARLAAYRPAAWPRQQRAPGWTVVVEADSAAVDELTATVDSVLAGTRGDVEIAVRGADDAHRQLAWRYAEEPRYRDLDTVELGTRVLLVAEGSLLGHDTLVELARRHADQAAALLLVTHAGDDRRSCATSIETGAWHRAAALAGLQVAGPPPAEALRAVLETHYRSWWCNADDIGLRRPGAAPMASDLLDGTSAPSRRVLAELERQQQLLASTRADLRRAERDLARLRGHPLVRAGLAMRRRLP